MKASLIHEPPLDFGLGSHIDIRFGLMAYGPLDSSAPPSPKAIRVGIIGTPETVEGTVAWLERCRREIPAKQSRQPNLFPRFPGFDSETPFRATLLTNEKLQRTVAEKELRAIIGGDVLGHCISDLVSRFVVELQHLVETARPDVVVCALPMILVELMNADEPDSYSPDEARPSAARSHRRDFHDLLKARSMSLHTPIQLLLPMTYDETKRLRQKRRPTETRRLQDEATRAWNLHVALYYKAGWIPWRLARQPSDLTTCYVGISFYRAADGSALRTSSAQIFNERGEGIIVRGGPVSLSKEDRQPHLTEADAHALLADALEKYRAEHHTLPARLVLHKTSWFDAFELHGFHSAGEQYGLDTMDLVSVGNASTRLFRNGDYPPLRGTFLNLSDKDHVLYTRGSVEFFATYPGMYVPRPLLVRCAETTQTPTFLANEIMALTKMNWNNTQFDGAEPITTGAARRVSRVLKCIEEGGLVAPRYSFYM